MGACSSATNLTDVPAMPAADAEKIHPQIFAIMRNGHEVLRGTLVDASASLQRPDADAEVLKAFAKDWDAFVHWSFLHQRMEDGVPGEASGLFALLDEVAGGIATSSKLPDEHLKIITLEHAITQALTKRDLPALRSAFATFMPENDQHYKMEEDVMMPQIMKLAKDGHPVRKTMIERILPAVPASELYFFISHAMRTLEQHSGGQPRARAFAHALQAAASSEKQWLAWRVLIQRSLPPEEYAKIAKEIDLTIWGQACYA
ncbi:hypothetical protein T492DRAFT_834792 [Pavlovales sp. CCMP2436]|nr:hypothetical protein T492DRAFT_834792 [Pavlovales sp. CCMP2436]|eukprot:CAMPEP_0179926860 /NCGR_PEP_ID=MMETSP0983-20121128/8005_1 /TAXON_ID=483367 /ORGANISM="non described non described, Strain CCMP 2436" /LENGTH=259 /DNA_ID=CAMNT_0021830517 /DNA_START=44 /DNA_END=823 /DNA_ORIENTATION=+